MKAAIVGGGVIGGGWAARFLLNGWDVDVFDTDPEAERKISEILASARRSYPALYDCALPPEGVLRFCDSLTKAVKMADWVQESVPERLELKHKVLTSIQAHASGDAVLGSSTSGFKPTQLQEQAIRPAQILVCHPFNPVYLLPLVEVVASSATDRSICERCMGILSQVGMKPLRVRKEIDAHIADRLLEAMWRESLWLINDGIATTQEIDDAICFGFGLRWAQMGLFETYRIAGGEAGISHFISQFGPALKWPWSRLMDVPELTDELVERIARQSDTQAGGVTIRQMERIRDDSLVAILRVLKKIGRAAGETLRNHEKTLPALKQENDDTILTVDRQVPRSWTDYNDHMNEAHYMEAFAQATDQFMAVIGVDTHYIAEGKSYFTVESHLRYLDEVKGGQRINITTQVLSGKGEKLHLFHRMHKADGRLAATGEHLLLHVDLHTRRSCRPGAKVAEGLSHFACRAAEVPTPEGAGRFVGQMNVKV